MKPEHDKVIEAMANDLFFALCGNDENAAIRYALQAAQRRGWVLAKLPRRKPYDFEQTLEQKAMTVAHNFCLDVIETIELEESK